MPRKKTDTPQDNGGQGQKNQQQNVKDAVKTLVDRMEKEAHLEPTKTAYVPGASEVYGTFANFLKSYMGEDFADISDEAALDAWEKAFQILSRFVRHMTSAEETPQQTKELILKKYAEIEAAGQELFDTQAAVSVVGKRVKAVDFPLDKVNATIWRLLEKDMRGQIAIAAESAKDKRKNKEMNIYYSIDFSALDNSVRISRQLEAYDKRVYIAIGALWAAGNQIITASQIYFSMGGEGKPAPAQLKKIDDAITKMSAAKIYINNSEEANSYKYPVVTYDSALLPMERIKATVNGNTVESAVHLFREPPLISFARGRKQITQIKRQLLTTPLSWTNQNLALEDYLLECIGHAKRGTRSKRMLFGTIYTEARVTDKKQKQRAPEKIRAILDYYQKCGYIKGYVANDEGITLVL